MKELKFDIFINQDTGRTFYRGLFIYGCLYSFKNFHITTNQQNLVNMVERDFWKPSNCFIQMRPRLRLFYTAMACSFIPYFTKKAAYYVNKEEQWHLFYLPSIVVGAIDGALTSAICLAPLKSNYMMIHAFATVVGSVYGLAYSYIIRRHVFKQYKNLEIEKI